MTFNNRYGFGGRPSLFTPVVLNLIIINALVYLGQVTTGGINGWLTTKLVLIGPTSPFFVSTQLPYRLFTHMFAHANFLHILFNMYALWLFGTMLERNWGGKKFLIFYLACGLGAAFAQILITPSEIALGASGAIMGLLGAFAYTFPNMQFYIIPFPFPIKAKWLAVIFALIDLFGGISGIGGIAHFAHLGGLVTGLILMVVWIAPKKKRY